ncbi:MAG: hypothetical protein WC197_06810 [Candidatus Gastranaerophilaceae bacterium]|jgi:hypothetical protein
MCCDKKATVYLLFTTTKFRLTEKQWWEKMIMTTEKIKKSCNKWKKEHPEKVKEEKRRYYRNNFEKEKLRIQKWRNTHREKVRETYRKWLKSNPRKYDSTYYKSHIDQKRIIEHRRRARKLNANGSFTLCEWIDLKRKQNFSCLCCFRKEPDIMLTADHIIPLSKWAEWEKNNNPNYRGNDIHNIQGLCGRCNCVKYDRILTIKELQKIIEN